MSPYCWCFEVFLLKSSSCRQGWDLHVGPDQGWMPEPVSVPAVSHQLLCSRSLPPPGISTWGWRLEGSTRVSLEEEVFRQCSVVVSRGGVDSVDDLAFRTEMPGGGGTVRHRGTEPPFTYFSALHLPFFLLPFLLPSVFSSSSSSFFKLGHTERWRSSAGVLKIYN